MNLGYTTLNPARLPKGLEFALIDASDLVVMLPDWRRSNGAMMERQHAIESGITIENYESLVRKKLNELEETLNVE